MKSNEKTAQQFKQEVIAHLDEMARALHRQAEGQRNCNNWEESIFTSRRAGAYECAAQYVRAMETHITTI